MTKITVGLLWKLRRVAADLRQQDVAKAIGISTTRYSGIERGEILPTELEAQLVEGFLPPLPSTKFQMDAKEVSEGITA